jgi:hypothetical protein
MEAIFLDKFIRDLKSKIKTEVEIHDPQILVETIHLADRYDIIVYRRSHLVSSQSFYPDISGQAMRSFFVPKQSHEEDIRGESMQLDILHIVHNDPLTPVQISVFRVKTQSLKKFTGEE